MATKTRRRNATGGTPGGPGSNAPQQPGPGSAFRMPKFSTRSRYVPDTRNIAVAVSPTQGLQTNVPLTSLEQLDIVRAETLTITGLEQSWTHGLGKTLTVSPFFPASQFLQITFKLQAAYESYNQTGPLAQIIQAYRPLIGWKHPSSAQRNAFASPGGSVPLTDGTQFNSPDMTIEIPLSWTFDEYYELDIKGNPLRKVYDAIVTPQFMAAQARQVTPTVVMAPGLLVNDLLDAPVAAATGDATSAYALVQSGTLRMSRDCWWTAKNPAANPPQYKWQYTRDYFTSPTAGQSPATVLLQNTGVSVGQLMSVYGFVWDPARNGGLGGVVPMSAIQTIQLVTGGSLQNYIYTPAEITYRMKSMYGDALNGFPSGVFVLDWALREDGGYLTNEGLVNTYLVNGVAVVITFNSGSVPGASSTVYVGTEALKLATS